MGYNVVKDLTLSAVVFAALLVEGILLTWALWPG